MSTYDLVDGRDILGLASEKVLEMLDPKVAVGPRGEARSASVRKRESHHLLEEVYAPDSDGPDFAGILCAAATFPHRRAHVRPSVRVVDQVQVDVVESGLFQRNVDALFDPGGVGPVVHKFGREIDLGPRGARLGDKVVDGAATVGFVLVPFGACFISFLEVRQSVFLLLR